MVPQLGAHANRSSDKHNRYCERTVWSLLPTAGGFLDTRFLPWSGRLRLLQWVSNLRHLKPSCHCPNRQSLSEPGPQQPRPEETQDRSETGPQWL
ncbi:MAG: hypothetical protein ACI8UD_003422 [Planctomycetota bacterium]|jgi:hypothetical protein